MGRLNLVSPAARVGLLASIVAGAGLLVSGAAVSTVADTSVRSTAAGTSVMGIGVGGERAVVSALVDAGSRSAKSSFMQLPFAESFPSASGGRAPRLVLVSFSEHFDSRYVPERLRTERSVDGGKTFTQLATNVPISSMTYFFIEGLVRSSS